MGRSRNARKRKRALRALAVNTGQGIINQKQDSNKFAPPEYNNRKLPTEVDTENLKHDGDGQNEPARRKGKGKEKKRAERKARMSMGKIILDPGVTEVTVRWADGVERTVKLSGGVSGVDGTLCSAGVVESKKIEDTKESAVKGESRESSLSKEISSDERNVTRARESSNPPTDTIGPSSADFIQETQPSQFLPQTEFQRQPSSPAPVEIADSQASEDEDSFHDSQEYLNRAARRETFEYAVQATQTTPKAQHMFSVQESPVLGRSSEREEHARGDDRMEVCNSSSPPAPDELAHRDGHMKEYNSSSPPVPDRQDRRDERMEECNSPSPPVRKEPSPELPKLRRVVKPRVTRRAPGSSQSLPTPRAKPANKWMIPAAGSFTPKPISQIKRQYDPYDLIPSPPPKRILRSTTKPFAKPPWKLGEPEPISSSATDATVKTPGKAKPSLVSPFPVISEEELVSIFSSPDPHFDKFDLGSATHEADAPELPPPRHNARRREDRGELSDDTSFSAVMSTPLKNYGKTPAIRSLPRPRLVSIHKRTPMARTPESAVKSRRLANKLAAVLGSLPTSSAGEAESLSDMSRSGTSTNATTPTAEAAPVLAHDKQPIPVVSKTMPAVNKTMPVANKTRIEVQIPAMSSLRQSQHDAVSFTTPDTAPRFSSPAANSTPRQETTGGSIRSAPTSNSTPRQETTGGSVRAAPTAVSTPAGRVSTTVKDTPPLNSATKMCTPIPAPRPWLNATRGGSSASKAMGSSAEKPAAASARLIVQQVTPQREELSPALEEELSHGGKEETSALRKKKTPVPRKKKTPASRKKQTPISLEKETPITLEKEALVPPKKQTPVPLPPHIARMMMS